MRGPRALLRNRENISRGTNCSELGDIYVLMRLAWTWSPLNGGSGALCGGAITTISPLEGSVPISIQSAVMVLSVQMRSTMHDTTSTRSVRTHRGHVFPIAVENQGRASGVLLSLHGRCRRTIRSRGGGMTILAVSPRSKTNASLPSRDQRISSGFIQPEWRYRRPRKIARSSSSGSERGEQELLWDRSVLVSMAL